MKVIYVILATAGWAWLVVAAALVWLRLRYLRARAAEPGLDVIGKHEQQHRSNGPSPA
jgi:hypothetical protein